MFSRLANETHTTENVSEESYSACIASLIAPDKYNLQVTEHYRILRFDTRVRSE